MPRWAFSPFQSERNWAEEEVVEAVSSSQSFVALLSCQAMIIASASTGVLGVLGDWGLCCQELATGFFLGDMS